jgi:hypothetical protein
MVISDYLDKFYDYLNWENKGMSTSRMGLVANAPQEAIDAYEQYKKEEIEMLDEDDEYSE